jgi:hypothetical protein
LDYELNQMNTYFNGFKTILSQIKIPCEGLKNKQKCG